jgi:hypothetical protein
MKQHYTKALFAGALILAATGTLAVSAHGIYGNLQSNTAAQAAIKSGDLNAFKEAIKSQAATDANNITQTQFTEIQTREANRAAREAAITAKDYAAFVKTFDTTTGRAAPTEAEFAKIIERQAKKVDIEARLTVAAKAADKTSFINILTEWQTYLEANRPADNVDNGRTKPTPTDAQKMVRQEALYTQALTDVAAGKTVTLVGGKGGFGGGRGGHVGMAK